MHDGVDDLLPPLGQEARAGLAAKWGVVVVDRGGWAGQRWCTEWAKSGLTMTRWVMPCLGEVDNTINKQLELLATRPHAMQ